MKSVLLPEEEGSREQNLVPPSHRVLCSTIHSNLCVLFDLKIMSLNRIEPWYLSGNLEIGGHVKSVIYISV